MAGCGTGLIMCVYLCVLIGKNLDEIQGRFCLVKEDGIGPNDQKSSLLWKMIVDPEAANLINTNKREKQST